MSTRDRKVIYSLEVVSGRGAAAEIASLSKGFKQVADDAERARRAITATMDADRRARTTTAGSGASSGARATAMRAGSSSFSLGMSAGAKAIQDERRERELNLRALSTEASRRNQVAAASENLAKTNLRIIDGYRQISSG